MLNKVGLSFEDYIMTVVGSGSEAGRSTKTQHDKKKKRCKRFSCFTRSKRI